MVDVPRPSRRAGGLVITRGKDFNNGWVVPSLDLVFVRLGDGQKFPKDFEKDLVLKVLAAVEK